MTRLVSFLAFFLLAFFIPGGFAGPACSKQQWGKTDCIQRCKSKWGWSGSMMGTDPWGSVMKKTDTSTDAWNAVIANACGTDVVTPSGKAIGSVKTGSLASPSLSTTSSSVVESSTHASSSSSTHVLVVTSSTHASSSSSTHASLVATESVSIASAKTSSSKIFAVSTKPTPTPSLEPATSSKLVTSIKHTTTSVKDSTTTPNAAPTTTSKAAQTSSVAHAQPSVAAPSSGTSNSDIQAYLSSHNTIRAAHGAAALTWSDSLASVAQGWANKCVFQHSGGVLGPFGENLAAGTGDGYTIQTAVKAWTDESKDYDPGNPVPSHFTQVVWKATTQVGCAVQSCDGIFDASFGKAHYYVCEYSPQGNIIGRFGENVQA